MHDQAASTGVGRGLLDESLDTAVVLKVQGKLARNQGHGNDKYQYLYYSF
jgi:hypothetical protein